MSQGFEDDFGEILSRGNQAEGFPEFGEPGEMPPDPSGEIPASAEDPIDDGGGLELEFPDDPDHPAGHSDAAHLENASEIIKRLNELDQKADSIALYLGDIQRSQTKALSSQMTVTAEMMKKFAAIEASLAKQQQEASGLKSVVEAQPKGTPIPLAYKIASLLGVSGTAVAALLTAVILAIAGWFTPQLKVNPNFHGPGVIIQQGDSSPADGRKLTNEELRQKLRSGLGK